MIHYSYNEYHLGDNLLHLHFLRKMALMHPQHEFIHYVNSCYIPQLLDAVCDIPTIHLKDIASMHPGGGPYGRNVWKNAGGYWENHRLRNEFGPFYVEWFNLLASEMGLSCPITRPSDLLFDYPKLLEPAWPGQEFDYLVINSRPCSGQFLAYDHVDYFDPLLLKLRAAGKSVVVTQDSTVAMASGARCTATDMTHQHSPLTITQIGNLSLRCKNIIAVPSGPFWPCRNVWAQPEKLVICIGVPERAIAPAAYCASLEEVEKDLGL